jgi:hypothetical protein
MMSNNMTTDTLQTPAPASVLKNLGEVRAMIKRHKLNDYIFSLIGLLALTLALLTLLTLFTDLVMDGYQRFNMEFLSEFPSRRAAKAGLFCVGHAGDVFSRGAHGCGSWFVFRRICAKELVC